MSNKMTFKTSIYIELNEPSDLCTESIDLAFDGLERMRKK